MRRWLVLIVVVAAVLAVGLVPFATPIAAGADLHVRCRGALVEAWPEAESTRSGWFNYAPNGEGLVYASNPLGRSVCGDEARQRVLAATVVVALAAVAAAIVSRRRRASRRRTGR